MTDTCCEDRETWGGGSDLIQAAAREAVSGQGTFQLYLWDFPGGVVDKNPPANAGAVGSIPGPGRSTCTTAVEPASLELRNRRSRCSEKPTHRSEG